MIKLNSKYESKSRRKLYLPIGYALGGRYELALACVVSIASSNPKIGQNHYYELDVCSVSSMI